MLAQKRIQANPCESKENNSLSFSGSLSFSYCLNNMIPQQSISKLSEVTPVCLKHLTLKQQQQKKLDFVF